MSTIVMCNVDNLPELNRQQLEEMLGRELKPDQRVFIIVDALYPGQR